MLDLIDPCRRRCRALGYKRHCVLRLRGHNCEASPYLGVARNWWPLVQDSTRTSCTYITSTPVSPHTVVSQHTSPKALSPTHYAGCPDFHPLYSPAPPELPGGSPSPPAQDPDAHLMPNRTTSTARQPAPNAPKPANCHRHPPRVRPPSGHSTGNAVAHGGLTRDSCPTASKHSSRPTVTPVWGHHHSRGTQYEARPRHAAVAADNPSA